MCVCVYIVNSYVIIVNFDLKSRSFKLLVMSV